MPDNFWPLIRYKFSSNSHQSPSFTDRYHFFFLTQKGLLEQLFYFNLIPASLTGSQLCIFLSAYCEIILSSVLPYLSMFQQMVLRCQFVQYNQFHYQILTDYRKIVQTPEFQFYLTKEYIQMEENQKCESNSIQSYSEILPKQYQDQQDTEYQILKSFPNPVHIISPDFKASHLKKLVQQLQRFKIPLQFQNQTQTLGYDLTKIPNNFFIVVDNKTGKINLGEEFISERMTIVGYPKIGRNQNNFYCTQPRQVVQAYKHFIAFKSGKTSKPVDQYAGGSHLSIKQNIFKASKSQNSHIKLKCVSRLKPNSKMNIRYDEQYKVKSKYNINQGKGFSKLQRNCILLIFNPEKSNQDNNASTSIIEQTQYKKMLDKISKNGHQYDAHTCYRYVFQLKSFADLADKLIDLKRKQTAKSNYFILVQSRNIDLMLKVNQNAHVLNQTKLIVCFFAHNHDNKNPSYYNEDQQKKLEISKKCNKLKNFYSLIFTQQQCLQTLKQNGISLDKDSKRFPSKKSLSKTKNNLDDLLKKKLQSQKIDFKSNNIQKCLDKIIIGQEQKKQVKKLFKQSQSQVNQQQKEKDVFLSGDKSQLTKNLQLKSRTIRPISSLLSERSYKSSVSSFISNNKVKIIKINKQKSTINNQDKHISQVNSQYCTKIVDKILSETQKRRKSISGGNSHNIKVQKKSVYQQQFNKPLRSRSSSKSIRSQRTSYRKLKLLQNNTPQYYVVTQSCQSIADSKVLVNSNQQSNSPQTPVFNDANQYYFGAEYSFIDSSNNGVHHHMHAIDGIIYTQHNEIICQLIKMFKLKCPMSLIPKKQYYPFYFSREYSQQIKKISKQKSLRECVSLFLDMQGLQQVVKYYSNVFSSDEQLQYYSNVKEKQQNQIYQKFSQTAKSGSSLRIICFVLIQQELEQNEDSFLKLKGLLHKLPIFKIHKIVNKKNFDFQILKQGNSQNLNLLYQHIFSKIIGESVFQKEKNGFGLLKTK